MSELRFQCASPSRTATDDEHRDDETVDGNDTSHDNGNDRLKGKIRAHDGHDRDSDTGLGRTIGGTERWARGKHGEPPKQGQKRRKKRRTGENDGRGGTHHTKERRIGRAELGGEVNNGRWRGSGGHSFSLRKMHGQRQRNDSRTDVRYAKEKKRKGEKKSKRSSLSLSTSHPKAPSSPYGQVKGEAQSAMGKKAASQGRECAPSGRSLSPLGALSRMMTNYGVLVD